VANWFEPETEIVEGWKRWVSERPASVREVIEKHEFAPWKLYRLIDADHRVTIYSFEEHEQPPFVTLKVSVSKDFNFVFFERLVFGVLPEMLVECDLPKPGELVGSSKIWISRGGES